MSPSSPAAVDLEPALSALLGAEVAPATETAAVDGAVPRLAATPTSVTALAATLAIANEHLAAVIPWGSGSQMALGSPPSRYDIALNTGELDRVVAHEPADLTVTVEAGMTLGRLQELLAQDGQFLPIDGPSKATIGGLLAVGRGGPSQHAYGPPRDWLLGCRIALADGTFVKAGGHVVKNVAGYDLTRMVVGSLGTLGVIVEVTLKVAPLPPATETILVDHATAAGAFQAVSLATERGLALRATAVAGTNAAYWLSGPAAAVERSRRELREAAVAEFQRLSTPAGAEFWNTLCAPVNSFDLEVRASVLPSAIAATFQELHAGGEDLGFGTELIAYPTAGILIARITQGTIHSYVTFIERARRIAVAAGGSLLVTIAQVDVKNRVDVWGRVEALPLMRRLKEEIDPRGTLNPGRFVGAL